MKENKVLTLYYHRVNHLERDYNLLCVSPVKFRQQMLYLKNHFPIARFEEDWTRLDGDAVVITFDDGYLDNLENALPVLEELDIPATIFVSTGTMNQKRELWWDELERLLLIGGGFPNSFRLEDDEFGCEWPTGSLELRENCYQAVHYLMKNLVTPGKRELWMRQLWAWRGMKPEARGDHLTLSKEACRRLAESPVITIGAHTVFHPSLAGLDAEKQREEIVTSVRELSGITGKEVGVFSYPFGCPGVDFNGDTGDICRRAGIRKAASTQNALWDSSTDPYAVPRKIVRNWGLFEFADKIEEYWGEG